MYNCNTCDKEITKLKDIKLGHCGPCRHHAELVVVRQSIDDGPIDRQLKNIRNRKRNNKGSRHFLDMRDQPRLLQFKKWIGGAQEWDMVNKKMKLVYPLKLKSTDQVFKEAEGL